ncbi:MAG: hypothetical protein HQL14_02640 [Candidatus Omnitrophica bacterium]|nr:hypothetical protein [Candidatus Omnitrophota bacterium]
MKHSLFVLLILAVFSTGCTVYQIDSKDTSQDFYAPKTSIDQVTYLEKVDKPYTEIGTVTVTTERNQSIDEVLPKLKQEAAILGADAITDVKCDSTDMWKQLKPQKLLANAYIRTNYTAKAIIWK